MRESSACANRHEVQGVDSRICRSLAACMGIVGLAWVLSGVLTLCVLELRVIGLFGWPPERGSAVWLGAMGVVLLTFGVLTNLPAVAFRRAAGTLYVDEGELGRALRRLRLLYALHASFVVGVILMLAVYVWCLPLWER